MAETIKSDLLAENFIKNHLYKFITIGNDGKSTKINITTLYTKLTEITDPLSPTQQNKLLNNLFEIFSNKDTMDGFFKLISQDFTNSTQADKDTILSNFFFDKSDPDNFNMLLNIKTLLKDILSCNLYYLFNIDLNALVTHLAIYDNKLEPYKSSLELCYYLNNISPHVGINKDTKKIIANFSASSDIDKGNIFRFGKLTSGSCKRLMEALGDKVVINEMQKVNINNDYSYFNNDFSKCSKEIQDIFKRQLDDLLNKEDLINNNKLDELMAIQLKELFLENKYFDRQKKPVIYYHNKALGNQEEFINEIKNISESSYFFQLLSTETLTPETLAVMRQYGAGYLNSFIFDKINPNILSKQFLTNLQTYDNNFYTEFLKHKDSYYSDKIIFASIIISVVLINAGLGIYSLYSAKIFENFIDNKSNNIQIEINN